MKDIRAAAQSEEIRQLLAEQTSLIDNPINDLVIGVAKPSKKDTRWYRREYLNANTSEMDVGFGKIGTDKPFSESLRELERLQKAGKTKEFHALVRKLTYIKRSMELVKGL